MGIISDRKCFSEKMLSDLATRVNTIDKIGLQPDFCIYVTGSYALKEASQYSDLDLFFINKQTTNSVSKIDKILIDAQLIGIVEQLNIPPFSGDGEYLEIHDLDKIITELGSRNDDYYNYFTARLLLLLESHPVYNEEAFHQVLEEIINRYYVDFNSHAKDFEPVFLVNDIIRFWRTMCLNYEHKRNRIDNTNTEDKTKSIKSHIKNLKLRYSRKLTCFSFLLHILSMEGVIGKESIYQTARMTPIQRLIDIGAKKPRVSNNINSILELYEEFLNFTGCDKEILEEKIADGDTRSAIFDKSRQFGKELYTTMQGLERNDLMMYLVI